MSPLPPTSVQVADTTVTAGDLLVGQHLRRVIRLHEPSRTRAWIATMFEADPDGEIEQVALWGMYRMQFEPHHVEDAVAPIPPLAVATEVITVMESVFRPDSYVAADGQKRYVIRGLKLRPAIERDAVLDDMFRAPDPTPSAPAPSTPHHLANAVNSLNTPSSSAALGNNVTHHQVHQAQPAPPQLPVARSADLLDEADILKIVSFPEPYRTRLWIASLFEPDPTSNAGPGGGGVEQVTLWQLYQKQLTQYVVEGAPSDKFVPPLAPATEVIKAVQDVFPEGRVVVRLEDGKTHYMIIGIKLRPSNFRSPALKSLLSITATKIPNNVTHNGSIGNSSQTDPVAPQLVSKVDSLVKTVEELQNVIKKQESTIKQELAWSATRQINLRTSDSNTSILRPLSIAPPHGAPAFPVDFPKTVEEAQRLDYTQCVALLERYGQYNLIIEGNEERTRTGLLEFIGCVPQELSLAENYVSNYDICIPAT
ncbi:Chromatin structure-remodeling complex protein rsc9 [Puccinia graminis f. sp. tritici]|uniref:Chromatin structure-remodeling complex protein rsc9 n=1 Tax=Puccinia graminis f. sp. tritici TaxID=56615 RepID=A0A5B0PHN5_PUCGR|nr:Chromatin structure-remodeling complex protein rsc9 [Puccinia graminis f. sp. tritici]